MKTKLILALAALLCGCASNESPISCVSYDLVPITAADKVWSVNGHCTAWEIGPTREQRQRFNRAQFPFP